MVAPASGRDTPREQGSGLHDTLEFTVAAASDAHSVQSGLQGYNRQVVPGEPCGIIGYTPAA